MYFLLEKKNGLGLVRRLTPQEQRLQPILAQVPSAEEIHGCIVQKKGKALCCTIQVPLQEETGDAQSRQRVPILGQGHTFAKFVFWIQTDGIWFVDYDGLLDKLMVRLERLNGEKTAEQMLYRLLQMLVENDIHTLDVIYKQLAALEEEIPKENARFFLQKMYTMKHSIYQMFRYYHQLTELADDLMEWDGDFLVKEEMEHFDRFITRTKRLADDMEIMREYAMEICEIYQSQISIRQNDIMKVLTIVTTIFLPLSLLAGWYGMNFTYMPELSWKYGYPMVICLSIGIVAFSLFLFCRKKYW